LAYITNEVGSNAEVPTLSPYFPHLIPGVRGRELFIALADKLTFRQFTAPQEKNH
jgi:hypothetical protein